MKRLMTAILIASAASAALAADETPQRYLVATKERPQAVSERVARPGLEVVNFSSVRGFAATLTKAEVDALGRDPDVSFVEPDPKRYLHTDRDPSQSAVRRFSYAAATAESTSQFHPYGVWQVQAPPVWSVARGAGIKVGVVDTGIDSRHPDLAANLRGGQTFVGTGLSPLQDGAGHGTHVAGTIAALDNGIGVVGVAPEAEIYSLRVFDENAEYTNGSALIQVIDWAIANGIKVLNMSLGGPESSQLERAAFDRAAQNGVLIFASSGNDGKRIVNYPAAYDGAVAVGAIDEGRVLAGFSTFGEFLEIVGPGVGVLSSVPIDAGVVPLLTGDGVPGIAASLMTNSPAARFNGEYVFCQLGKAGQFPASVTGKIALIERGELTFAEKAKNAKAAGAIGVIIFNNVSGGINGTLGDEPFAWPVTVSITQEEGDILLAAPAGTRLSLDFVQGYDFNQGTSMSCPHVAGVAALLWSLKPTASASAIRDAILHTAIDLGAQGWDERYGFGAVNALAAARELAPELFPRSRPARR